MVRAIIFDCFGVIITEVLKPLVEKIETSDPNAAQQVVLTIREGNRGLITPAETNRRVAAILGISVPAWRRRIRSGEVRNDQLLAYIQELRGQYKTALLSNIAGQSLFRRFSKNELSQYFDVLIISSELGVVKPEPEIYLKAARELRVKPIDCVMVDDSQRHCDGAGAVGMQTVLYKDFKQAKRDIETFIS